MHFCKKRKCNLILRVTVTRCIVGRPGSFFQVTFFETFYKNYLFPFVHSEIYLHICWFIMKIALEWVQINLELVKWFLTISFWIWRKYHILTFFLNAEFVVSMVSIKCPWVSEDAAQPSSLPAGRLADWQTSYVKAFYFCEDSFSCYLTSKYFLFIVKN